MTRMRFLSVLLTLVGSMLVGQPGEARSQVVVVDDDYMYAAIAYSPATGRYGYSWNCDTRSEAEQRALRACKADDARIVCWVNNGFCALALGDDKSCWGVGWSWGDGASTTSARQRALYECNKRTDNARVVICVASGYGPIR